VDPLNQGTQSSQSSQSSQKTLGIVSLEKKNFSACSAFNVVIGIAA